MAKDGTVQAPSRGAMPSVPVEKDDYWNTEEGRDLQAMMDQVESGRLDLDTAQRQFRQKWYGGSAPKVTQPEYSTGPKIPQRPW